MTLEKRKKSDKKMAKCKKKKKKIKNLCYSRHVDFSKLCPGALFSCCLPDVRGARGSQNTQAPPIQYRLVFTKKCKTKRGKII